MKLHVFSIFDAKAAAFLNPFTAPTYGVAERNLQTEANSPDSMINKYPEDYTLYSIGEFDSDTGALTPKPAEAIVTAAGLVARSQAN